MTELITKFCIIAFVAFLSGSHYFFWVIGRDAGYKEAMKEVEERNGGTWTE